MGLQLIFVVETNRKNKSDWMYINATLKHFYKIHDPHIKTTPIYMDGKDKYNRKEREINSKIDAYEVDSTNKRSQVIYCFDCDNYDIRYEDQKFLENVQQYCIDKGYDFVWFCKDIEHVYLGKQIPDNQKKKEAEKFLIKELVSNIDTTKLHHSKFQPQTSNLMLVLDKYLTRK